jgi:D-aspartate ligase
MNDVGALIIGGDYRGLGIVRSLGRRGVPVWVVKHDDVLAGLSRYAKRTFPWPGGSDAEQAEYLLDLAAKYDLKGWVLYPTSDVSADLVARHHEALGDVYRLTTPPLHQFEIAQDKRAAYSKAESLGIDVPRTWYPESAEEVAGLDLEYPVILKPASGVIDNPLSHVKAWKIDDREMLLEKFAEASPFLPPGQTMIQEIIPGGGECQFSFAAACLDGKVHAFLTARRTRQIPMDFGRASTFVETMDVPEIIDPSTRMIADIGLTGLVEIEFKQDPRTNKFKLLDVNSRSWGWHSIAAAAGVDFPYLVWQLAQGEEVEFAQGRAGVRWVRLTTDLSVAGREVLGGRIPLRTYLKSIRPPVEGPVSAKDDPLPTLMELPLLGRRFVNRVRHKLRFTKKPAPAT